MLGWAMPRAAKSRTVPGELALIESIRRSAARIRPATHALRTGIGDDCAVLRPAAGHEICVTTDFSLEGAHFRRNWHPPQSAGHRCLARGLSDIAAMGAEPLAVFLSLAVPATTPATWVDGFMAGLLSLAARYRIPLAGGDTAQSPAPAGSRSAIVAADIVAIGHLPAGSARLRSGAKPGDFLYVTGSLGGAAAELLALSRHPRKFRKLTQAEPGHPHLYPEPRIAMGRRLRALASAMIDISDGLSTDLTHICQESGVAAIIDESALPVSGLALEAERSGAAPSALHLALHGGEDYELLFAAPEARRMPGSIAGVPVHRIGRLTPQRGKQPLIRLITAGGDDISIAPGGWEHFRKG